METCNNCKARFSTGEQCDCAYGAVIKFRQAMRRMRKRERRAAQRGGR